MVQLENSLPIALDLVIHVLALKALHELPLLLQHLRVASFYMFCPVPYSSTRLVRSIRLPRLLRLQNGHLFMLLARHTLFQMFHTHLC